MRGRLISAEKWWPAAGLVLAWVTVSDVGFIPRRAVADVLTPVALGAAVGLVTTLVVLAAAARFGVSSRWKRRRSSARWMGRPRFVDWLALITAVEIELLLSRWLEAQHIDHLGELILGLVDGIVIAVVVMHVVRRAVAPPGTSPPV